MKRGVKKFISLVLILSLLGWLAGFPFETKMAHADVGTGPAVQAAYKFYSDTSGTNFAGDAVSAWADLNGSAQWAAASFTAGPSSGSVGLTLSASNAQHITKLCYGIRVETGERWACVGHGVNSSEVGLDPAGYGGGQDTSYINTGVSAQFDSSYIPLGKVRLTFKGSLSESSVNIDFSSSTVDWFTTPLNSQDGVAGFNNASIRLDVLTGNGDLPGDESVTTGFPAPTADIKANNSDGPITVSSGSSFTLNWTSTNADWCVASGGWSGAKDSMGSQSSSLTSSAGFVVTCRGPGGSATDSVTVNVESEGDTVVVIVVVNGNSLSVNADVSVAFAPANVLTTAQQTATPTGASAFNIDVADTTGSGAGWDLTMTVTNLTIAAVREVTDVDGNDTITASGYNGTYGEQSAPKKYRIKITTAGAPGTAVFQWNVDGGAWTNNVATTSGRIIIERSLAITFDGTYEIGDEWLVGVDVLPYDNGSGGLAIDTVGATPTAVSGSIDGVTNTDTAAGAINSTTATSSSITLTSAALFRGMGSYQTKINFTQDIHANPLAGTYTSTIEVSLL